MSLKSTLFRSALLTLHKSRLHSLSPRRLSGVGIVFMLHRVRPAPETNGFAPNALLEITPEYLNAVLTTVTALGYDLVSMDEAHRRLQQRRFDRKFAVFTLDDGYKDNLEVAAPIFAKHKAPFTVYLSSGMPDGTLDLWWVGLEAAIRAQDTLEWTWAGTRYEFSMVSAEQKQNAFETLYWPLRNLPQLDQRIAMRDLAGHCGVDMRQVTRECALTWDEARELSKHAYCNLGAHTVDHFALSKLTETEARRELVEGAERIKQETGDWPRHLAFPYGDGGSAGPREYELAHFLGFDTAVTTQKGFLTETHGVNPYSMPRLSLNGDYQDLRMLEVLMSGLPFALASLLPSVETA
ncbi:polysaccharide deacetylase family protein [Parvibaculaceae bacterium PLY_AMNH_Bact1]|nr:polysaccharide deacetylase family protein [Parvibaculaceae bacterium PLY_AMNH_Bact1]